MTIFVNLPVEAKHLPKVIAAYSAILADAAGSESNGPSDQTARPAAAQQPVSASEDWTEAELRKLYFDSGPNMRTVLKLLAENGDRPVSGDEIASAIRKERGHAVAGMMGAFGRRLKHRHRGRWPFDASWNALNTRWEYTMPEQIAVLLRTIIAGTT